MVSDLRMRLVDAGGYCELCGEEGQASTPRGARGDTAGLLPQAL